jgi:hypothetical protein
MSFAVLWQHVFQIVVCVLPMGYVVTKGKRVRVFEVSHRRRRELRPLCFDASSQSNRKHIRPCPQPLSPLDYPLRPLLMRKYFVPKESNVKRFNETFAHSVAEWHVNNLDLP